MSKFIFVALLICLALAQARKPSPKSSTPFVFTIVNDLGIDLKLYWVDYNGILQYMATISAGSMATQSSLLQHEWYLTSDSKDLNKGIVLGTGLFLNTNVFIKASELKSATGYYTNTVTTVSTPVVTITTTVRPINPTTMAYQNNDRTTIVSSTTFDKSTCEQEYVRRKMSIVASKNQISQEEYGVRIADLTAFYTKCFST